MKLKHKNRPPASVDFFKCISPSKGKQTGVG
jgi:hypothetical protein